MLIILSKSLKDENYDSILSLAAKLAEKGEKIVALHTQDACVAATSAEYCSRLLESKIEMYAVKADVEAQGLSGKIRPNVKVVNYRRWVNLLMNEHRNTVSWTS